MRLRQGDVVAQECSSGRRVDPLVPDGVPALPEPSDRDPGNHVRPREKGWRAGVTDTDRTVFVLLEQQPERHTEVLLRPDRT